MFYYNYFFNPLHFFFNLIGWIVIAWLIIWLLRGSRRSKFWSDGNHNRAVDILKERYAKGEISKGEFEEKKKDLQNLQN